MHSYNYRGGMITVRHSTTLEPEVMAYRHGRSFGPYRSESAAKGALTRYHQEWLRERNAEHMQAIRDIWEGPRHV